MKTFIACLFITTNLLGKGKGWGELERTGKYYVWASYLVISFRLVVFKRLKDLEGNLVYEVSNRIVLILVLVSVLVH